MSMADLLYVRNMNAQSESEDDENEVDAWDDGRLNKAYEKALKTANIEVAQRLAMSTNTKTAKDGSKLKNPLPKPPSKSLKKEKLKWKAGMHCRAVYEQDGLEYEAFLVRVISDKECVVRFIGYENSEIVPINTLKPSLGKTARNKQMEEALTDNLEDGVSIESDTAEKMQCSDRPQSPGSLASLKRKKSRNNKPKQRNEFTFPELPPIQMSDITQLKNMCARDMPFPPPPPLGFMNPSNDLEDKAISSMLLGWYMSGYYTGLYQGMKSAREERKHQ